MSSTQIPRDVSEFYRLIHEANALDRRAGELCDSSGTIQPQYRKQFEDLSRRSAELVSRAFTLAEERPEIWTWQFAAQLDSKDESLFEVTANPVFVWRSYRRCRRLGAPIPSWVLAAFDYMADRVDAVMEQGGSPQDLLIALRVSRSRGRGKPQLARAASRRWDIAATVLSETRRSAIASELAGTALPDPQTSMDTVAERFGTTTEFVKKCYYEWTEHDQREGPVFRKMRTAATE